MLSTLCSDPLCPVAVMHPVMRSAMLPCNLQTLFLANQRQGSIDSCSRLDRRRVTLRPVAVHLVKRDAMLSHLLSAVHRESISVQASCSAVDCGVQCSRLFLHARCNACKRSRQSVGLIVLCATMRAKQFNRCPGRLVLSSKKKENDVTARDKVLQIVQILCTAFAMRGVHISHWSTAHPVGCMCCTCANIKTCNSHLSHKWYKMTRGQTRSYQAWKKANRAMRVPKVAPLIIISIILLSLFYFYVLGNFN